MRAIVPLFVLSLLAPGLAGGLTGCRADAARPAAPTMSYEAYIAEAARLEGEATRHEEAAEVARQRGATYECETHPESEQTTSGAERLQGTRVCDDVAASDRRRHEDEAERLREDAGRWRGMARSLLDTDRAACAGLSFDVLRDPPLRRYAAKARVEESGRGALITLEGGGVDMGALQRELGCHRARAALLGYDPAYMPSEPVVVAGARVEVTAGAGGVVTVLIESDDTGAVELIRRRAAALVGREASE